MLIIGAGGFAKELVQVLQDLNVNEPIYFYDDITKELPDLLLGGFEIIRDTNTAQKIFSEISNKFILGIGNPILREKLAAKMTNCGGQLVSAISPFASIGSCQVTIGNGSTILAGARLSNSCSLGKGCLVYYNAVITHDCKLGNYIEVSPSVNVLGNVTIGDYCKLGAGCIILPNITLGNNVIVGAGAVVTKSFTDGVTIAGVPAKIIKK